MMDLEIEQYLNLSLKISKHNLEKLLDAHARYPIRVSQMRLDDIVFTCQKSKNSATWWKIINWN